MFVRDGGTIATEHHVVDVRRDAGGRVTGVVVGDAVRPGRDRGAPRRDRRGRWLRGQPGAPGRCTGRPAAPSGRWRRRGTNTGELIEACAKAGAATDYSGEGWFCPGLAHPDGSGTFTLGFRSGLMVDQTGRRYGNECLPYDRFGRIMAEAPERIPSWFVFDDREGGRLPAIAMPEGDPADHLAAGTWVRADTHRGPRRADRCRSRRALARPSSGSTASPRPASTRTSDAARTSTTRSSPVAPGPNKALTPLDQPPYVAARFVLSDLGTKGGLVTDAAGRVLDARDRRPDPGSLRQQQLGGIGLRVALPRSGRTARGRDGVRVARGPRPARGLTGAVTPRPSRGGRAPSSAPRPGPAPARG